MKRKSLPLFLLALTLAVSAFAGDGGVVNINTADATQLALLPRVGASAAARIIQYRTQHGPFTKVTDLMQVKGFGEKTFERLRPYVAIDGKTTLAAKVKIPGKPRAKKQPANTASK